MLVLLIFLFFYISVHNKYVTLVTNTYRKMNMPSDQKLFQDDNTNPQATPAPATPEVSPNELFADQLAVIKNAEGAPKYNTVEDAITALQHSQQYIPELKDKVSTQEQLISELQAKLEAQSSVQDIVTKQTPPTDVTPTSGASLSETDIEALVTQKLAAQSQETKQQTNASLVSETLTAKFGTDAQAKIGQKATELGMKPSELGALSKTNPAMVLALFGETQTGTPNPSVGSYTIPANPPEVKPLEAPEKSLLRGSTSKAQAEYMAKVREEVYRKHGITQ